MVGCVFTFVKLNIELRLCWAVSLVQKMFVSTVKNVFCGSAVKSRKFWSILMYMMVMLL